MVEPGVITRPVCPVPFPVHHAPCPTVLCKTFSCSKSLCWRYQAQPFAPLFHTSQVLAKVIIRVFPCLSEESRPAPLQWCWQAWLAAPSHCCDAGLTCRRPLRGWVLWWKTGPLNLSIPSSQHSVWPTVAVQQMFVKWRAVLIGLMLSSRLHPTVNKIQ